MDRHLATLAILIRLWGALALVVGVSLLLLALGALAILIDPGGRSVAFAAGLTEREARWMRTREWARTADDVLDRRSKLGLLMSPAERAAFTTWWDQTFAA